MGSGPQAGEKFTSDKATPETEEQFGPLQPPKLTAPTKDGPVVSSTQNLKLSWERLTEVEPLLSTSNSSEAWLPLREVNSLSCNWTELVPQPVPPVGLGVGVAVTVGAEVTVEVGVRVAVDVDVEVTAGDGVFVLDGVAAPVGLEVAVEALVAVRVAVRVGVKVAWAVAVAVGEGVLVGVEVKARVDVKVGLRVAVGVLVGVPDGVAAEVGVDVAVEPDGVQVATARQDGGTPPEAVTRLPW